MSRFFTPTERQFNTNRSMGQGTLGGTVRAASPLLPRAYQAGAPRIVPSAAAGTPTFFVAASNATAFEKSIASDQASGSGDELLLQGVLDSVGDSSRVVLSSGTFVLSSPIQLNNNQTLEGLGFGTVLQAEAGRWSGDALVRIFSGVFAEAGTTIRNLTLDVNSQAAHGLTGLFNFQFSVLVEHVRAQRADVGFAGLNNTMIKDCYAQNCIIGYELYDSVYAEACSAESCSEEGFDIAGSTLVDCTAVSCGTAGGGSEADPLFCGFRFGGSSVGTGLTAISCYHGFSLSFSGSNMIKGFSSISSSGNGVLIAPTSRNHLLDGYIRSSGGYGILLLADDNPASYNKISNCVFSNNGNSTHDDIKLSKTSTGVIIDNMVLNNKFIDSHARYHVNLADAGVTNTWVAMNDMRANGITGRINNAGTGTNTAPGNRGIDF